ncbi:hypothetical protein VULLAG_LOCUS12682 [Vulpes lagopus]
MQQSAGVTHQAKPRKGGGKGRDAMERLPCARRGAPTFTTHLGCNNAHDTGRKRRKLNNLQREETRAAAWDSGRHDFLVGAFLRLGPGQGSTGEPHGGCRHPHPQGKEDSCSECAHRLTPGATRRPQQHRQQAATNACHPASQQGPLQGSEWALAPF